MPNEPKKRHSRARQGKRRSAIHLTVTKSIVCKNCGSQHTSHVVCPTCGYYKGQQFSKPARTGTKSETR